MQLKSILCIVYAVRGSLSAPSQDTSCADYYIDVIQVKCLHSRGVGASGPVINRQVAQCRQSPLLRIPSGSFVEMLFCNLLQRR